jgi:predicted XRE-type DNA-binding protein
MDKFSIQNIQKISSLNNELEYEKATSLFLELRVLEKEDKSYLQHRNHLRELIKGYEKKEWSNESEITEQQINESDAAEHLIQAENEFHYKRKELIKKKLKEVSLNQSDLAKILGHRKGYMSELINNGLRPFSKDDLVVINRLFKINFDDLIPAFVDQKRVSYIQKTLESLANNKLRMPFGLFVDN